MARYVDVVQSSRGSRETITDSSGNPVAAPWAMGSGGYAMGSGTGTR